MSKFDKALPAEEKKLLKRLYWRSQNYAMLWSYSRWCGNATTWVLYPYINWLYPNPEDREKKLAALKREQGLMNITPQMAPIMYSLFCTMEKEARDNPNFDVSSIEAIRAALQGPLSGIGDSIWWVTWRLVATGVALPLVAAGNPIGFLLFFFLFNIPSYIFRKIVLYKSYEMGTSLISKAEESGVFDKLIRGASIVGLIMIGYMVSQNVSVPLALSFSIQGQPYNVLELINSIVPGILSLGAVGLMAKILKKNVKIVYIIFGLLGVCILGALVGIF